MFLSSFKNRLPNCQVAHAIRQSYLYKKNKNSNVGAYVSKIYPLKYYYVKNEHTTSFYYTKNDVIYYYIYSIWDNFVRVIPLYNYLENDYHIILSGISYNFMNHHALCIVKAPNNKIYVIGTQYVLGLVSASDITSSVSESTKLYEMPHDMTYLFHSMPIANSFVLFLLTDGKTIFIYVIDLIKEKTYTRGYHIGGILEKIIAMFEENNLYRSLADFIRTSKVIDFDKKVTNNINNSISNLVFYDRCVVYISLFLENTKTGDRTTLRDVFSVIATYQNNELVVIFQINSSIKVESYYYNYDIDFGSVTILSTNKYKLDNKYNISKSHLYSVIVSAGDYTIISEPNISWNTFSLYHKNNIAAKLSDVHLIVNNFSDILFIRAFDKHLALANRDKLLKANRVNRYYVESNDNYINIIDTKLIRSLLLDRIRINNNTDTVSIDITDKVKHVRLKDKLEEQVRRYVCRNGVFTSFLYAYHIDYRKEELYFLVYFNCVEVVDNQLVGLDKIRICLLRCKIGYLFSGRGLFEIVAWSEFDVEHSPRDVSNILYNKAISGDYSEILRLLGSKWNTGNLLVDLRVFEIYDKASGYYDYKYNRRSIKVKPIETSITSSLHLVDNITKAL